MKRPLLLFLCTTIVAAFQVSPAAAVVVSDDVAVPGGADRVARAFGLETAPDKGRFVAEIIRLAYDTPEGKNPLADAWLESLRIRRGDATAADPAVRDLVPVPLLAAVWSDAVFHRRVSSDALFAAIVGDRRAALLCHGLAALDDETLAYLSEHPTVVRRLYDRDAAAFAVFSAAVHVRSNRVVPPGGERAAELWEAVIGEKVTSPDRFLPELFERAEGRTAYLYDAIGALDKAHAAFALGWWMKIDVDRLERFKALNRINSGAFREWHVKTLPFARPIYDLATMLDRVRVEDSGRPLPPASQSVWARAFQSDSSTQVADSQLLDSEAPPIDAAWLADRLSSDLHGRAERLDQLSFGQRVFGRVTRDQSAALISILRDLPRYRMLLLTLDRIGIVDPSVYVAATRQAARIAQFDGHRAFVTLAQFQGALALVARMHASRTVDTTRAEAMVKSLVAVPIGDDGYAGGIAQWIAREFQPFESSYESALIALIAGARPDAPAPTRVTWEGQQYRLDLPAVEERRLRRVRERQGGPSLDVAIELDAIVNRLHDDRPDLPGAIVALKAIQPAVPSRRKPIPGEFVPPGVDPPRALGDLLARAIDDLSKTEKANDSSRVVRAVAPLAAVIDALLGEALMSLTYAIDIGDPAGTALLIGNVAKRHDFGLGTPDRSQRIRATWSLPRQDVAPGVPWHVSGAALGLDVALASLALRRLEVDRIGAAPRLTSNERQTFATSVALLNAFALTDEDRDAIAEGIDRGRRRVSALAAGSMTVDATFDAIDLDPPRRRALAWTIAHEPDRVTQMFSLTELLYLGGSPAASLDAWGMAELPISGCLCTKLARPGLWRRLTGRPQLGWLATTVADLNLSVAVALHELHLPAVLARQVLGIAMQDFIDDVKPAHTDDWLTLVRGAQSVPRERLEDYVAAVASDWPLVRDPDAYLAKHQ